MNIIEKAAAKLDKASSKKTGDADIIERAIRAIESREETAAVREKIDPFPSQYSLLN